MFRHKLCRSFTSSHLHLSPLQINTQEEMRVMGDAYVPAEETVKLNKKELKNTLKRAKSKPRVYSQAVTKRTAEPPKGFESLFLDFNAETDIEILWVDQPPKGVYVAVVCVCI